MMQEYQECLRHLVRMAKTTNISKTQISESLIRPQERMQGTAITTDIWSRPQQLQRSSPARHLHGILPTTPRRRCFRPSGESFAPHRLNLGWRRSGLGKCRNVEEIRKSILHGLEILENIMERIRNRTKAMSQRHQLASKTLPETSTQGFSNDLVWDPR